MTIALNDRRSGPYTATAAQTVFDFDFPIKAAADLVVTRRRAGVDTVLAYPSAFTLAPGSIDDPDGGQIVLVTGATAGDQIVIEGDRDAVRSTAFADERAIRGPALNAEFDNAQAQIQEVRRIAERALPRDPFTDTFNAGGRRIGKVAEPVEQDDIATKDYVDNVLTGDIRDELEALLASAEIAAETASDQASIATLGASTATSQALASQASAEDAAQSQDDAETAQAAAEAAQEAAESALSGIAGYRGLFASVAHALGNGIVGRGAIVAGSGGTNGTYPIALTGGTAVYPAQGFYTISGGALTAITITKPGYYTANPTAFNLAGVPGLTGASAAPVMGSNCGVGDFFAVPSSLDYESLIIYRVDAGPVATEVKRLAATRNFTIRHVFGTAGQLEAADNQRVIAVHSDEPAVLTVPLSTVAAVPAGGEIEVHLIGAGPLSIAPATDVVFKYRGGLDLVGDGAAAVIRKIGTDRLWSHGDLEQYQAPVSDFYVDSVAGNNGNPGTSAAAAFAGLSVAAAAMSNDKKVSLARGSVWNDKLNLAAITGGKVAVHGSGAVPIISASDVATAWTQPDAGTYPNVWYKAGWSSECINGNFPVHVFENGSDLAAINFAGGAPSAGNLTSLNAAVVPTSLVPTTPDGTDDVYINVQGNPNTNGKEYRISKRASCVYANTVGNANFTVTGPLDLRDAPWASGALVGANNSNFSRALIRNSTNHGIFLASGSVEDVVFHGSTKRLNAGGSNYLVFFSATPGTYNGSAKRVGFLAGDNPSNGTFEDVAAFFSHNDQPGAVHNCATEQCWLVNISSMGGFRGGAHAHVGPYVKNSGAANLETGTTPAAVPIRYGLFNGGASNVLLSSWDAVHAFENCASYDHKPLRTGNGFSSLRSAWFMSSAANIGITQPVGGGIPNLSVNYSILIAQSWNYCIDMSGLTSYTGNFNIFGSLFTGRQARFRYNGVENSAAGPTQYKLKWWQDATGQDAQSVYVLLADQAAGNQNALWLGYVEAAPGTNLATIGPAVGDFRINPLARVYDGNDTARIGVFADGVTPITLAGPQLRWDWNLRAPSNGPPRRWPVVPETGSQGATYIANPAAWNFYP